MKERPGSSPAGGWSSAARSRDPGRRRQRRPARRQRGGTVANGTPSGIRISVTAPGRIGSSRLDVECDDCGTRESRYAPRGPVSVEYVATTNVLATTFTTATGRVRVTDSLNTGISGRLPWSELARRIEGLEGSVPMRAAVRPGTCLNTPAPWVHDTVHGPVLRVGALTMAVRTLGADDVATGERQIEATFTTGPGSRHMVALVATSGRPLFLPPAEAIDEGIDRTV